MISNNYECLYSCYMKFENIAVVVLGDQMNNENNLI